MANTQGRRPDGPGPVREALAAVSHAIWAHWMRYMFSQCVRRDDGVMLIPADKVERWERQMQTDYADLTEREKESDRHQADKILAVLPTPVAAPTWSQDVPTVQGDWWMYASHTHEARVELVTVRAVGYDPDLWRVQFDPNDDENWGYICRGEEWTGYYWLPATVPQPPEEVGP